MVHTAQHCRLGPFQDSHLAGDLEDSKSTSGEILCIFGSRTFVPVSWMCEKPTSVSHSSTESGVISLDAGLWVDGSPALDLWDMVTGVLHSSKKVLASRNRSREEINVPASGNQSRNETQNIHTNPNTKTKKRTNRDDLELLNVHHVAANAKPFHFEASFTFLRTMKQ